MTRYPRDHKPDVEHRREAERVGRELDQKRPATGSKRSGWFPLIGLLIVIAIGVAAVVFS